MHSQRVFSGVIIALWLVVGLVGCGGSAAGGGEDTMGGMAGGDAASKPAPPPDPLADQARTYCDHEVKKSEMQPPDTLNRKQIQACLTAVRSVLNSDCGKGVAREVVLKIIIEKTGVVSGAFPLGDAADSPEAACVAQKVKEVKFPKFKGQGQQVIEKYPFNLQP